MRVPLLCALLLTMFASCASPNHHADKKIKVLVLTGGHGFKAEPFFKLFSDNPQITFTADKQVKAAEGYDRDDLFSYDVVVLYDSPSNITDAQKARFLALFDKGIGVVVLHHAYLSYPMWTEYERISGGKYVYLNSEDAEREVTRFWKEEQRTIIRLTVKELLDGNFAHRLA